MKKLLTILFAYALGLNLSAQDECLNPDVNCDGYVNVNDLLGLLGYFGDEDLDGDGVWDSQDDCVCPVTGCTDSEAINFDPNAIENDGSCVFEWLLIGDNIDGTLGFFGKSVAVNSSGSSMVVGAPYYNVNCSSSGGAVYVYDLIESLWVQRGGEIIGTCSEQWGKAVDISDDGNLIVIGIPNQNGSFGPGLVVAYTWVNGGWVQLGNSIEGMEDGDDFGSCVALSSDGSRVVAGAPHADDVNGNNHGSVFIYDWTGEEWSLSGDVLFGESADDRFGSSVDMSSEGMRIAAGAPFNDGNGNNRGQIRVFEQVEGAWIQIGADINGDNAFSNFGTSVSISGNGLIVTGGATACQECGNGQEWGSPVRVFQFSNMEWNQMGSDITSDDDNSMFGESLSLSHDGYRIVIGEPEYDALNQVGCGRARVFNFDLSGWQQVGGDVYGNESGVDLGSSVSITSSGGSFVVGSPAFNGGRVQFFSGN